MKWRSLSVNEIEVFLRREPAVHQHETKFQVVLKAGIDHLAHKLVIRHITFALDLPNLYVAVLERLFHQLKRHRDGLAVAVVQRIQKIVPPDTHPLPLQLQRCSTNSPCANQGLFFSFVKPGRAGCITSVIYLMNCCFKVTVLKRPLNLFDLASFPLYSRLMGQGINTPSNKIRGTCS